MSNKDTAIYMIPASCMFLTLIIGEKCYDAGKLWIPIMLTAIAVIVIAAKKKKKTSAQTEQKADVNFNSNISRAYCSTGRR